MSDEKNQKSISLVGAGLVGSLLGVFLAKREYEVEIFERRPDMRKNEISAGRSINLAVSARGLRALDKVGLEKDILKKAIPMRGRMVHPSSGDVNFQPYGRSETEYINSISRAELNKSLMTAAESSGKVKIHFNKRVTGMDVESNILNLYDETNGKTGGLNFKRLIGTDGSASAIRYELAKRPGYKNTESLLEYGYKELVIPPGPHGSFLMEKNALHIWPRGTYMLIALPNFDGSFTATLFLPFKGSPSFSELVSPFTLLDFFEKEFSDVTPLMPELEEAFFTNPTGQMVTIKCSPWNFEDKVMLLGDAAHAIVPFFGQGMNCGFEDCTVFDKLLSETGGDLPSIFKEFGLQRKTHTDAIADMAIENFIEMRDKVADEKFLLAKKVEKILQDRFPHDYISRYALVTFSQVPYRVAYDAGLIQNEILSELCTKLEMAEQVDLDKARTLILEKLKPFFDKHEVRI